MFCIFSRVLKQFLVDVKSGWELWRHQEFFFLLCRPCLLLSLSLLFFIETFLFRITGISFLQKDSRMTFFLKKPSTLAPPPVAPLFRARIGRDRAGWWAWLLSLGPGRSTTEARSVDCWAKISGKPRESEGNPRKTEGKQRENRNKMYPQGKIGKSMGIPKQWKWDLSERRPKNWELISSKIPKIPATSQGAHCLLVSFSYWKASLKLQRPKDLSRYLPENLLKTPQQILRSFLVLLVVALGVQETSQNVASPQCLSS